MPLKLLEREVAAAPLGILLSLRIMRGIAVHGRSTFKPASEALSDTQLGHHVASQSDRGTGGELNEPIATSCRPTSPN